MAQGEDGKTNTDARQSDASQGSYHVERPSPHRVFESMQQENEIQTQRDLAETNTTGERLLDGLKGVLDAKCGTGDRDVAADRWLHEKHGAAPYVEVVKTFDMEADHIDKIAERAIRESQEYQKAFEAQQQVADGESTGQQPGDEQTAAQEAERQQALMEERAKAILNRATEGKEAGQSHTQGQGQDLSHRR